MEGNQMTELTNQELTKVVYKYIGVSRDGYLNGFSYRTHSEFYPVYCRLDIDPNGIEGTTRERFIQILKNAEPVDQAKIIMGIIDKFDMEDNPNPPETRTPELRGELLRIAKRLKCGSMVDSPELTITNKTIEAALNDAEVLLSTGSTMGIDRVHTILQGFLREECKREGITYAKEDSMARLLKLIGKSHPKFQQCTPWAEQRNSVLKSFGEVLDALNRIRNDGSLAHANDILIEEKEAQLFINASRTVLQYLNAIFEDDEPNS